MTYILISSIKPYNIVNNYMKPKYFIPIDELYSKIIELMKKVKEGTDKLYCVHVLIPETDVTKGGDFIFCISSIAGDIALYLDDDECVVADIETRARNIEAAKKRKLFLKIKGALMASLCT